MLATVKRQGCCRVLALVLAVWLGWSCVPAMAQPQRQVPVNRESVQLSFSPIVKQAAPAVVNVYVRGSVTVRSPFDDPIVRQLFGDRLGMPQERIQSSLGSGVLVSPDGVIVTNTHVIKVGSKAEIRVVLADKREFDAKVILQDEKADIAILRIEGGSGDFPYLQFANSDEIEVGDMVLAIGNPFGVGQSVSQGIISALGRSLGTKSNAPAFIQTDAAVNPGNSGGALVDLSGHVVGINTAILSGSGASHGIGFAVPSNLVKVFVDSAIAGRKVERPWLGARVDSITREMAQGLGLERAAGVLVSRVSPQGPAAEARLEPGDVIIAVDGQPVADAQELQYRLTTRGVGARVTLSIVRQGRQSTAVVALRGVPAESPTEARNLTGQHPFEGARVATVSPAIAEELGIDDDGGVAVLQIARGSFAERFGFQRGDVVITFDGQPVQNASTLEEQLKARAIERRQQAAQRQRLTPWLITIKRGSETKQFGPR
ncbi:MAG: Do family serine endopeptidase [Hyphomicrobiaceae bacterium]